MENVFLDYLGISATVGAVVLLIMLASPLINRRYAAKWKYYIWIFLAIRLLVPLSGMYPSEPTPPVPTSTDIVPELSDTAPMLTDIAPTSESPVHDYKPSEPEHVETPPAQARRFVVEIPIVTVDRLAPPPETSTAKPMPSLFDMVIAAWIGGALIIVAVPLIGCFHCKHKITRDGEIITDGDISYILQHTKSQLKIKRKVMPIRYSKAASPMIIGFIKPLLVLPCDEYTQEELQFIIRHELIHLKRGDVYVKLLSVLANALHWFNPLIWLMRRETEIDMELSCDEGVIKGADINIKKAYTETLLSSIRRRSTKGSALTTQFYGGKKTMKKRFINILSRGAKKNGVSVLALAMALAIISSTMVGCSQQETTSVLGTMDIVDAINKVDTKQKVDMKQKVDPLSKIDTTQKVDTNSIRLLSASRNIIGDGELYRKDSGAFRNTLTYIDFDTMVYTPVCSRPDCAHRRRDNCPAYNFTVYPCIIGSKLYGFEHHGKVDENGKVVDAGVFVFMANADGSRITRIDTLDVEIMEHQTAALIGTTIYFIGMEIEKDPSDPNAQNYIKYSLCSYDFDKMEFVNYGLLSEGYDGVAYIIGRYKGGLYIKNQVFSERFEYEKDMSAIASDDSSDSEDMKAKRAWSKAYEEYKNKYKETNSFRFDLETGEIGNSDLPLTFDGFLTDDLYGYLTQDPDWEYHYILNIPQENGTTRRYWGVEHVDEPINGYLFISDSSAIELATGQERALKKDAIPLGYVVQAYSNGNYILVKNPLSSREYLVVSEKDMFAE